MQTNKAFGNRLAGANDSVIYGRYSSDHQRPSSIMDQADEACRFVERRSLPALGRLVDDQGISVKDGMTPNFHGLLDDVRNGRVKQIVVDELSRISRVPRDILYVQSICRFYRVALWTVHENINIIDDDADIHVLFLWL